MGIRETEEKVRTQPSAVAQVGATRPFPNFSGDHWMMENRQVAYRRQKEGVGQLVFASRNLNQDAMS